MAIISCEELNKNYNGNCRKLVTDYMEEKPEIKKKFQEPDEFTEPMESNEPTEPTEPPIYEYNELLNYWATIRNISNMLDSSIKNFNLKELESTYEKIKKRVENVYLNSTDDFLNFLDSSIKNNTKYLN